MNAICRGSKESVLQPYTASVTGLSSLTWSGKKSAWSATAWISFISWIHVIRKYCVGYQILHSVFIGEEVLYKLLLPSQWWVPDNLPHMEIKWLAICQQSSCTMG